MEAKLEILKKLQQDLLLWQGFKPAEGEVADCIGLGEIEAAFPGGVFPRKAIHEFICAEPDQAAATDGFIGGLLSVLMADGAGCVWISTARRLFPPSLAAFNVEADHIIFVDVRNEKEVLWVMEEAFRSIGLDRRKALWEVSALQDIPVEIFKGQPSESVLETQVELPLMTQGEHVVQDYATVGLSLKAHPVSFVRPELEMLRILSTHSINNDATNGQLVKVAGLVLVRQRPGTAGGVCFITIEDETGFTNLVVFEKLFETYRKEILHSRLLMVEGRLQREGLVVHVIVSKCVDLTRMLGKLVQREADDLPVLTLSHAEVPNETFHGGRNFR